MDLTVYDLVEESSSNQKETNKTKHYCCNSYNLFIVHYVISKKLINILSEENSQLFSHFFSYKFDDFFVIRIWVQTYQKKIIVV